MPTRSGLDYSISRNQSQVAMTETMPEWAKDLEKNLKASINQSNQELHERINQSYQELHERISRLEIKRGIATELKPMQENDEVADHKNDKGETESKVQENDGVAEGEAESKPMDLEDPDEVKINKVEVVSIDQSDQDCDEVFKLSTDKIDGENSSELAINGKGIKKEEIIGPCYSLSPSTTTTSHASASSPPLLSFITNPLYSPPHHSLLHQHCYYQSDPSPPLIAQPDLSIVPHCCRSVLHLDMFIISASDEKCQYYLICWKGRPTKRSSRDDLRWLDPDLLKYYQSGLMQDPTDSTPFDPGGFLMITLQEDCPKQI